MTKIKNTKKGMAKKTLSVSLAVAMLATSNVPVWAAEFSDGADAAFTAEVETPVVEVEAPVVDEEIAPVAEATNIDAKVVENGWGKAATVNVKSLVSDLDPSTNITYIWKVDDVQGSGATATGTITGADIGTLTYIPTKLECGGNLKLCLSYTDTTDETKSFTWESEPVQISKFDITNAGIVTVNAKASTNTPVYNGKEHKNPTEWYQSVVVNNSSLTCDAAIKNDIFNGLNGKWNYSVITDKDYINADSKIKVKVTPTETDYFTGEAVSSEMTLQQKVIASTDLSVEYVGDSYTYSGTAVTLKKEDFKITDKLSGATVDSKYISTIKADGTNTSVSNAGEYTAKVNFTIGTDGLVNYKLSSADTETTDFAATNKWVINKLDLSTCEVFLGEIQGNTTGTPITSANLSKITIKKDGKIVANEVPLAGSGFVISNVQTNTGTPGTYTATVQTTATSSNYTGTSTTATFRGHIGVRYTKKCVKNL